METHVFHVVNMHCGDCAALIDETLLALPGVHRAHATMRTRDVRVALDPLLTGPDAVAGAITGLGFRLRPPAPDPPPADPAGSQVSDAAWAVLAPLLAPRRGRALDHRRLVEGIAYKHRTGVRWRAVPAEFGPWQTLYARWARWRADGTWTRLAAAAQRAGLTEELAWLAAAAASPDR
jgi:transposase/copper chaperone CopZ